MKKYAAFTLIEILMVVALIAILAGITFIAVSPAKNFRDTRNTQRSTDTTQILNAMSQYVSEPGRSTSTLEALVGVTLPPCQDDFVTTPTPLEIGTGAGLFDLNVLVDEYIVGIPVDPLTGSSEFSGYSVCKTVGSRLRVSAVMEGGGHVVVSR